VGVEVVLKEIQPSLDNIRWIRNEIMISEEELHVSNIISEI
jgi:hypothetical protein